MRSKIAEHAPSSRPHHMTRLTEEGEADYVRAIRLNERVEARTSIHLYGSSADRRSIISEG